MRREKGKFRSFLLASSTTISPNEWDRARAQKRGHDRLVSVDGGLAEARFSREPADALRPEKLFKKKWAMTLLESVVQKLQSEFESAGKSALFTALKFGIAGDQSKVSYTELSSSLGISEPALCVAVHRLRHNTNTLFYQ